MTQRQALATSKVTDADWRYPVISCNRDGMLRVENDPPHELYWQELGNPLGEPVMFLHGGPGGGCDATLARFFDPTRYRIILFDQRGCGKSRPSVTTAGPQIALSKNTTDHLIEDILKLREALAIKTKMHVFGGSWGSTLALAYAIRYPETVETLILRGIFIGREQDFLYMYQGNAATFETDPYGMPEPGSYISYPEAWKEFVEMIPPSKRGDMMKAYKEIFDLVPSHQSESQIQIDAARAWSAWEGAISNLIPDLKALGKFVQTDFAVCFAQIEAHYFAHQLFLPPNHFLDNAAILVKIPTHIVHGRFDQVCPLTQADLLVRALENAGGVPSTYKVTTAGHSMFERENYLALIDIMDKLPKMLASG